MHSILLVSLLCLAVSALAEPATISGTVVDEDGAPVTGANVYLVRKLFQPSYREVLVKSLKTDDAGKFTIADIEHDPPMRIAAFAPGLAVGAVHLSEDGTEFELVCAKPVPTSITLLDADGKPVAGTVTVMHISGGASLLSLWSFAFPPELCERYAGALDDTGTLAMTWVPATARVNAGIATPRYGTVRISAKSGDAAEFVLPRPGSIRGRITCEAEPTAAVGIKVMASARDRETLLGSTGETETDAEGRFEFPGMLPLQTDIMFMHDPEPKWVARRPEPFTVESGKTVELNIEMEPTYEVRGRVIDKETGEGIEGAKLYQQSSGGPYTDVPTVTDKDGYYKARCLSGEATMYISSAPGNYRSDDDRAECTVQVTDADTTAPDIALEKGVALAGIVVDKDGNPVAGAEVQCPDAIISPMALTATTDAEGKFEITHLAPDKEVSLRARLGDRMTRGKTSAKAGDEKPVRLVLEDNAACSLTIRVLDDEGEPVKGAKISPMWHEVNLGTIVSEGQTGPDGRFTTDSLWSIGSYQLHVTAPGHSSAKTGQWVAVPGAIHDFGEITLVAARGSLAGRVVDGEGNPVAGAHVRCPDGGPRPVSTVSDDAGAFRLEHLYSGTVAVIAEKQNLFGGALLTVGTEDGTLTITPDLEVSALGEPQVVRGKTTQQTDWQVARELIEECLEPPGTGPIADLLFGSVLAALARIDADRAFTVAAEYGGKHDDSVLVSLGGRLLKTNPEEAITYLQSIGSDSSRVSRLRDAAQKLMENDPERARAILEDAIPQCLAMSQPKYQACYLARCAEALYKLDPEAAEMPIRKAAELAENLSYDDWEAYARGCVAEALCLIDLDAALLLIEGIADDYESTRHQPNMAARLAATQPESALDLMESIPEDVRAEKWPRVLYNMAATHPDEAIEAARAIKDQDARARTLGYIAWAIRDRDPKLALTVFEEALHASLGSGGSGRQEGGRSRRASRWAELAQIAVRIGYPDPERIAWHAIAAKRATEFSPWGGGNYYDAQCIRALTFATPDLALAIAACQGPQAVRSSEPYTHEFEDLLITAACLDANLAAKLLRMMPDDDPEARHPAKLHAYSSVIRYLMRTPEERYIAAMTEYSDWVPGAEDAD